MITHVGPITPASARSPYWPAGYVPGFSRPAVQAQKLVTIAFVISHVGPGKEGRAQIHGFWLTWRSGHGFEERGIDGSYSPQAR